jgi:PAS domain S-box-containing protein
VISSAMPGTRSSDLFIALLDETREPLFALDQDGKILYLNAAAAATAGRVRKHLVGKPFPTLLQLPDRRKFRLALAKLDTAPVALDVKLEQDGSDSTPLVLRRLPGKGSRVIAASLGVEAPPPSEHAATPDLTTALDRFFLRFPHGVVGLGPERRMVFANPRARQLLDNPNVRIGRVLPADGALGEFADRVLKLPSVTQTAQLELGNSRVIRASGLGPRGDEPAILILEDITAAAQHDRVMREFLRNAAHQLRTPLTGIATAVEVLQSGAKNVPDERDRFLGHLEAHSRRLTRIARGLLVLARAQSGETMRLEFVELRPLLAELVQETTPQQGVKLSVECDPSLAALAERDLAREALAAIVENAVEHTYEGSIQLAAAENDGLVRISVTDSGGGILPEHRDRIFEPFYRPAEGSGFGLGLAIAAQAVRAMDGELFIEDAPGGSRFTVRLPSARILK